MDNESFSVDFGDLTDNNTTQSFSVEFGEVTNISTTDFNQLNNRPKYNDTTMTGNTNIPAITESTISGWGFTKNTGTYIKPSSGIPKSDLASGVQTSLGKADTAIQDISGKQDKLIAGSNITIASDGKTISATNTTYEAATESAAGLMSAADKTKLDGISSGAEVNVKSDWAENDSNSDAYILNKPTIPVVNNSTIAVQMNGSTVGTFTTNAASAKTINLGTVVTDVSGKQNTIDSSHKLSADLVDDSSTTNKFMTAAEKTKLSGIATGAEVNVQANWNETNTSSDAYIQNKPTIPTVNNSTITVQMNSSAVDSFTTNASSNKTIDLGTVITQHQDISGKLDTSKFYNDYYFSMPKTIYAKLNTEMKMYFNNITTANYLVRWGQYTNSTTIRDNDDYVSVLPTAKATKSIGYSVFDRYLNNIENGTTSFVINNTAPNSQTMLILGDSFVSQNYIGPDLRNLFSADGKTLTLIGTKGTSPNNNEGYAGWKYTDFVSGDRASTTPFWDGSKFNFSYYMQQQGYSTLNSVYIQLGTNDCSSASANQDFAGTLSAANTIVNSILSYNANIKIYLGLTVMPTLDTSKFAEKYNGIGFNWIMRANMQKLNKAIIDTFSNNSSIKIVANNLILDSTTDINDNVHPNSGGYQKIAEQIYYTMMS